MWKLTIVSLIAKAKYHRIAALFILNNLLFRPTWHKIVFIFTLQLHCHDFGHDGATTHPDLSSRDVSA